MPIDPISIGVAAASGLTGLVQGLIGSGQAKRANRQLNRLFKERKAFQTPEEIFDILKMRQWGSQKGYSSDSLEYLTGQADRGLSASLGSATRLGADPNQLGGIMDSYFQDIFRIGNENELLKMRKFDNLINATQLLAQNKEAEQISADNLIKDQMAALSTKVQAGQQNLQSGINLGLNALTTFATNNLYNERTKALGINPTTTYQGVGNRGLLDYVDPDLDAGGRPIPRNKSIFE